MATQQARRAYPAAARWLPGNGGQPALRPRRLRAIAAPEPGLGGRIALVRAQLAPISSRASLMDSWQREALYRLGADGTAGSDVAVLEVAYALRWLELADDDGAGEAGR